MSISNRWFYLTLLAFTGGVLYLLGPVLTPFLVAAGFAYLGDPIVDRLESWRLPRTAAVLVVFVVLSLAVLLVLLTVLPLLQQQLSSLFGRMPAFLDWLQQTALPWLAARAGIDPDLLSVSALKPALLEHWQSAGNTLGSLVGSLSSSGLAVVGWFGNVVLIPVVAFYLLRDWDRLVARLHSLVPRRYEARVADIVRECDGVIGAFLRGQLLVMLGLGTVYALGLWMVGLEVALLIGFLAGLASIVPYLGFIVGIIAASIAAFMQFHDWHPLVWVALVFGIGQVIEGFVLTPWLVGDRIGLHPVAVIFAVLAGGQLFGFVGVLLALPAAAVVKVLVAHLHRNYLRSEVYAAEPGVSGE